MSEFADPHIAKALTAAATCVITCFMNMVANKESKKCSADYLWSVIDFQKVISMQDDLLDQSSLQANKHVIEYSARIFKETRYERECYYVFRVNLELEFLDGIETETAKQTSYLLNIRNMRPFFHNISNPVLGRFSCLLVQMLLHIFEIRILVSTDNKKPRFMVFKLPVIQVKLDLQKFCIQIEDDEVIRNKLYNDFCDDLYKLQLNIDQCNLVEFDVLRERFSTELCRTPICIVRFERQANFSDKNEVFFIGGSGKLYKDPNLWRYNKEFEKEVFIDCGGFGKVYKARHCLDGKEYAIKKITVDHITELQLNEVTTLAALNHPNIVPYHTAWIEWLSSCTSNASTSNILSSKYYEKDSKSSSPLAIKDLEKCYTDESSSDVVFLQNNDINDRFEEHDSSTNNMEKKIEENTTEESSSGGVCFRNSKSNESPDQAIVNASASNSSSCEESNREVNVYTSDKNKPCILYIQMALCEQTLKQLLCNRVSVTPEPTIKAIFEQIVCGVDYIHSQKIIHHDIKPSNIFMSTSGPLRIQLGDFGLACSFQKEHHSAIGTPMYAAPEQMQGKCDPKSDIYSIGIVFLELLIPTRMELAKIIESLKSGEVPETLKEHKWLQIIQRLMQEDPTNRPSASQLLQDFNHNTVVIINRLKDDIMHLENSNNNKNDKIRSILQEIKEKIQELSLQNNLTD
ncbi:eukaryotic translation initiation factor 2-alpha kinase 1 [Solenopsis invicta]|uniref:eukaryotic translation initiation factor 2-alpha kinase 1 n=1 Tax=Solenopsis invicta TaxID=13686 RepID=UPI00193E4919|nr:eukaryotic translation initiation factor 2-alpha kinase 1 [Solenopsis invicta]XP_039306400.1 eukaryotic translation initiation factor 2-alpha kinase 1 [Solenopsis invicta]XP_039306401.1 eukaryotic translation initiation factor 2-alpha kinase 1 [Solenopsis invicta]